MRLLLVLAPATLWGCLFDSAAFDRRQAALGDPGPDDACVVVEGFLDADGDGVGGASTKWCLGEVGGLATGGDCDDTDGLVGAHTYADGDGDGVGGSEQGGCAGVAISGDCDDTSGAVGATTFVDADGDGHGSTEIQLGCAGARVSDDCDDALHQAHPGALEVPGTCIDEDCTGANEVTVAAGAAIQPVVDAACDGEVISIEPGVMRTEAIDLTASRGAARRGLVLRSAAPGLRVIFDGAPPLHLDDDTIEGLQFTGQQPPGSRGGCVVVEPGTGVVVRNTRFLSCAADSGGGLYAEGATDLQLVDSVFSGCSATTEGAALTCDACVSPTLTAVRVEDVASASASVVLSNVVDATLVDFDLSNSPPVEVRTGSGVLTVDRATFADALSGSAGGALRVHDAAALDVVLRDSSFEDSDSPASGGAVAIEGVRGVTISGCSFSDNETLGSGAAGGGLSVTDASSLDLTDTTFFGNDAPYGASFAVTDVDDTLVSGTSAESNVPGDGVYLNVAGAFAMTGGDVSGGAGAAVALGGLPGSYTFDGVTFGSSTTAVTGSAASVELTNTAFDYLGPFVNVDGTIQVSLTGSTVVGATASQALFALGGPSVEVADVTLTDCTAPALLSLSSTAASVSGVLVDGGGTAGQVAIVYFGVDDTLSFTTIRGWLGDSQVSMNHSAGRLDARNVVLTASDPTAYPYLLNAPNGGTIDVDLSVIHGLLDGNVRLGDVVWTDAPVLDVTGELVTVPPQGGVNVGPCFEDPPINSDACDAGFHGDR